jgi:hypothetical protein
MSNVSGFEIGSQIVLDVSVPLGGARGGGARGALGRAYSCS